MYDKIRYLENLARDTHIGKRRYNRTASGFFCRGLYDKPLNQDAKRGYSSLLHFDFESYLSQNEIYPLIILDVGCGMAKFLSDVKSNYPLTEVFGIDRVFWNSYINDNHFIVGEVSKDNKSTAFLDLFPESTFNLITAVHSLTFQTKEVSKTLLVQIDRILSPDGIAKLYLPEESCDYIFKCDRLKSRINISNVYVDYIGENTASKYRILTIKRKN